MDLKPLMEKWGGVKRKKTRRSKREREGEREGGRSVWAEAC